MKKIIAFAAAVIGAAAAFSVGLYRIYLYTEIKKFPAGNPEKLRRWLRSVNYEETYKASRDGLFLHGIIVRQNSSRWAVLMHGYDSEGRNMSYLAEHFYNKGFNILMPDQRGYGCSEGKMTSMGEKEQYDVLDWIAYLNGSEAPSDIILYGISMGAATVMLAAGNELPKNITAAIEDCGYTSVYDEFSHNIRSLFHLPPKPFLFIVDIITKFKDGWSVRRDADCLKAVKKAKIPILFIHGSADNFVPFYMQDELFEAAECPKEKLVIYGAGHAESAETDPDKYWKCVDEFIDRWSR